MKLFFGICTLLIITIEVKGSTKIEIYGIRDTDNGLEIKNMNSNTENKPDPFLKLLREPKTKKTMKSETKGMKFVKELLGKLKSLRGEDKMSKLSDDAQIYILNSDDLDSDTSDEESVFVDVTRNDRAKSKIDTEKIRDLLMQLIPKKTKILQKKVRTLKPVSRADDDDEDVIAKSKSGHYEYDNSDDK